MVALDKASFKHYKELEIDSYDSFIDSDFEWACDECYSTKKAVEANPASQYYRWSPHMSYYDSHMVCSKCDADFVFNKAEKKLWFEKLKFSIHASPDNCTDCRKEMRLLKMENKALSEILKKEESEQSKEELEIVVKIYEKWAKTKRADYFRSKIKKKT